MKTIKIKAKNPLAVRLLEDLEAIGAIGIIGRELNETTKLSERLTGSITSDQANEMREELSKMRNEWDRENS